MADVHWMTGVVRKVIMPMILLPFVGFVGGYLLMIISWCVLRKPNPRGADRGFRIAMRQLQ